MVALAHVAEVVIVALPGRGSPRREHYAMTEWPLHNGAAIDATGVERLPVGSACRRQDRTRDRPALPVLPCGSGRGEERPTLMVVPENSWAEFAAVVAGQIRPAVAVHVVLCLPV